MRETSLIELHRTKEKCIYIYIVLIAKEMFSYVGSLFFIPSGVQINVSLTFIVLYRSWISKSTMILIINNKREREWGNE